MAYRSLLMVGFLTLAAPLALSSCAAVGVGAVGVTGVSAAQHGGLKSALSDAEIQARINDLWFKYDVDTFTKLDMTVNNGRVLITGVVQDPDDRVEAVRLAWQPDGVKQVINEIRVAESTGLVGYAKDAWITTRLRTRLTLSEEVQTLNYNIDTVQGTVYLMGHARSQEELDKAVEIARTVPNVQQVVSYVQIASEAVDAAPRDIVPDDR